MFHPLLVLECNLLTVLLSLNRILIISSAVFFPQDPDVSKPAGLFDAYDLIKATIGQGAATLFAVALLAAGQVGSVLFSIEAQFNRLLCTERVYSRHCRRTSSFRRVFGMENFGM